MVGKITQTSVSLRGGILWVSPNIGRIKHQDTIYRTLSTGELKHSVSQKTSSLNGPKLALSARHSRTQKYKREFMSGFTTKTRSSTQSSYAFGTADSIETIKLLAHYTMPYERTNCSPNKSMLKFHQHVHPYNSVGTTTRYRLDGPRSESRWRPDLPTHPDPTWGPTSLLYNGHRVSSLGLNLPGRGVEHLPSSEAGPDHGKSWRLACLLCNGPASFYLQPPTTKFVRTAVSKSRFYNNWWHYTHTHTHTHTHIYIYSFISIQPLGRF